MRLNKNDEESGKYRFKFMEMLREDVLRVRAETPPDDVPQVIVYVAYTDLATTGVSLNLVGQTDDSDETAALFDAVRTAIVETRRETENGEVLVDAPVTVRVLGAAHVLGARDLKAEMTGVSSGETLAEGYLANIVFTDMSNAFFIGQGDGLVTLAGCSAELAYVDNYLITHPIDASELPKGTRDDLKMLPGDSRPIEVELGLVVSLLTATEQELEILT